MRCALFLVLFGSLIAQEIKPEEFDPSQYPGIKAWLSNLPKKACKTVIVKLKEAMGNWREVADALLRTKKEELVYMAELLKTLEPLDLLEAKSDWLLEHLRYALKTRKEVPWKLDDKMFNKYILASHLYYTHFRPWRRFLYERFSKTLRKSTLLETALAVNRYIAKNIKHQKKRTSLYGWIRNPVEVVRSGWASLTAARGLCISLLRTLGVPARRHIRGWIEFFNGKEWLPIYPFNLKGFGNKNLAPQKHAYAEPGTLIIYFHKRKTPLVNFAGFSINKKSKNGLFDIVWHPFIGGRTGKDGTVKIKLPPGVYHLISGVRNRNGDPFIYHKVFKIEKGKTIKLDVDLAIPFSDYKESDWIVRRLSDEAKKAEFNLLGGGKVKMEELSSAKSALLYIFNLKSEPPVRMLPLVCQFSKRVEKALLLFIGEAKDKELSKQLAALGDHPPVAVISPEEVRKLFSLPYHKRRGVFKRLPSVLLFKGGKLLLWTEGFDLNIESVLEAAMSRE